MDKVAERLKEIAELIKRTGNPDKYKLELDKLLGTELEDRNEFAEQVYEESRNNYDQ